MNTILGLEPLNVILQHLNQAFKHFAITERTLRIGFPGRNEALELYTRPKDQFKSFLEDGFNCWFASCRKAPCQLFHP